MEKRVRYLTLQNSFNLRNIKQLIFLLATLLYSWKSGFKGYRKLREDGMMH